MQRFEDGWRAWLGRPTRVAPGHAAARVRAELGSAPRRRWTGRVAAVAAVLAVLLTVVVFLERRATGPRPAVRPAAEGVVVMWLDEDTPLYMNLEPLPMKGSNPS